MTAEGLQMARRRKKTRSRRKFTGINVLSLAEGYVQTNVWTNALFKVNPFEFVTGIVDGNYRPGADGGSRITIPELMGAGKAQVGGSFGSYAADLPDAIARNLSGGWMHKTDATLMTAAGGLVMPAIQTALIGAGFKFGKKLTRKPRSAVNRQLKMLGLGDTVRV
jgi:hypothetical protein